MPNVRKALDRALFDPSAQDLPRRRLGLLVVGLLLLGAWLIFWPFIPGILAAIVAAVLDLLSAIWSALSRIPWPEWPRRPD